MKYEYLSVSMLCSIMQVIYTFNYVRIKCFLFLQSSTGRMFRGKTNINIKLFILILTLIFVKPKANTASPVSASPKNDEQSAFNESNVPSDDGLTASASAETGEDKVEVPALNNDAEMTDNEVNVADDAQAQSGEQTTTIEDAPVTDGNKDSPVEGAGEAVTEAASPVEDARGSPAKDEGETEGEG